METESAANQIKDLISELSTLRFNISDNSEYSAEDIQRQAFRMQLHVLHSLKFLNTDEEDYHYVRDSLRQSHALLKILLEAHNKGKDKQGIEKIAQKLDEKYCEVQLFLSELSFADEASKRPMA